MHRTAVPKCMENNMTSVTGLEKDMRTPFVVLKMKASGPQETTDWLLDCITKPVARGGAGLQVFSAKDEETNEAAANTFLISASEDKFAQAAERFKLMKLTSDGSRQEFMVAEQDQFVTSGTDGFGSSLFTDTEKNYLILKSLNEICAEKTFRLTGFPRAKMIKDHPVVPKCVAKGVIEHLFPLHNQADLEDLKRNWYMNFKSWTIPAEQVKSYFGETIALYFVFLGFYNQFLIPPCLIAIGHRLFFDDKKLEDNAWFAGFNLVWATLFLEIWKRKCAELSYTWGSYKKDKDESLLLEEPRAEYHGQMRTSPITDEQEIYYPTWKRRLKMTFVTYPCLMISLMVAVYGMLFHFQMQRRIKRTYAGSSGIMASIARRVPGVIYACVISLFNSLYTRIATKLNDWENHRHESSYNNHIIVKLVLFHFVNSFLSLFYIAFYLQDIKLLRQHLATLLVTQQVIQQAQESLIPYLAFKRQCVSITKQGRKIALSHAVDRSQVLKECKLPVYHNTYGDYLELFLQFGYVFLFSAAYPLAAFWALLNNIVEVRSDAFKLCKLFQRPFPQSASSIGAWQVAFEGMSIIAVMTNCALIAMSESAREWLGDVSIVHYILIFVALEHAILVIKEFLSRVIPDTPGWVVRRLAKAEYQRRQLWKFQRRKYTSSTSSEPSQTVA